MQQRPEDVTQFRFYVADSERIARMGQPSDKPAAPPVSARPIMVLREVSRMSDDGPRGAPPKKDLPEAFDELREGLYYANLLFEEKEDAGRQGIITACHAVIRFIAVTHQNPELAAPLIALREAVRDLERGVANPIINPNAENSRRSRSALKKHASVIAAVCLEVLVELGDPVEESASRVARHVGGWRVLGGQPVTANTIKNWRNGFRSLPTIEREPFDLMRSDLLTCGNASKEIERLLHDGPPGTPKT